MVTLSEPIEGFFFNSTIYYMRHGGRPWQLLCNYIQKTHATWSKRKREGIKRQEKKKREKSYLNCLRGEKKEKGKLNLRKSYHFKINSEQLEVDCQ